MTASELMRAQPGTPAYDGLKQRIIAGDEAAAKDMVLAAAWHTLRGRTDLEPRKKVRLFHALVDSDFTVAVAPHG